MNVDTMRRLLLAEEDAGRLRSGTKVVRESCPGRARRLTRVKTCLEAQLALVSAEMATFTEVRFLYLADGSSRPLYDNYQEREALAIPAIAAALFTGGSDNNIGLGYMSDYRKIVKLLDANTGAARMSQVFEDFVEMAALAIRNAVDYCGRDEREAQYLRTAGRYDRASLNRFAQALALVIEEMDRDPCDVLGRLYMELEIGNERLGQFYTPYDVAELMAQMQIESVIEHVQTHGFADLYEPACGASSFSVAVSQAMLEHGLNPPDAAARDGRGHSSPGHTHDLHPSDAAAYPRGGAAPRHAHAANVRLVAHSRSCPGRLGSEAPPGPVRRRGTEAAQQGAARLRRISLHAPACRLRTRSAPSS
ncbi:N-6 DNA methylase [Streptomyces sp. NBC_01768]|uniref:N-6 DNA methylase n=1 Tax=Streptomyces sp. NBC_01768 TaxID=2975938 RepID=UPI002DDA42EE|nr:N-6 DNA methylase [Streptomyces sp. NBC_01768]WSC32269.1 N-6 DNA methylase [Streptomyces sp. NBC_01768]